MLWIIVVQNTTKERMEMTTPVITRRAPADGEKMEMTTPVITRRVIFGDIILLRLLGYGV